MTFPWQLQKAIEEETASYGEQALRQAAAELSETYRGDRVGQRAFIASDAHRLAYAAVRMPATFAAVSAVLAETHRLMPSNVFSLLDIGAGPGTVGWAATAVFDRLQDISLIERDAGLVSLAKSFAARGENAKLQAARWKQSDMRDIDDLPSADLVTASYALNELDVRDARRILASAWKAARAALVIIEPGTVDGFAIIRTFRDDLLALGAHLVAPCPHTDPCPMADGDWCHFSARSQRSSLHRRLKGGTLGYEDEKYSYVVAAKTPVTPAPARVLRHPARRSGHALLELCTQDGLRTQTVTRSDREAWKRVRKTDWGDAWA